MRGASSARTTTLRRSGELGSISEIVTRLKSPRAPRRRCDSSTRSRPSGSPSFTASSRRTTVSFVRSSPATTTWSTVVGAPGATRSTTAAEARSSENVTSGVTSACRYPPLR